MPSESLARREHDQLPRAPHSLPVTSPRSFGWPFLVGALLVFLIAMAFGTPPQNDPNRPSDSVWYVAMVTAATRSPATILSPPAPAPFRFRILAPLIASFLPFGPARSLEALTYASLAAAYGFILLTAIRLGLDKVSAVCGLVIACMFTAPLFAYYNPLLTDGCGLLAIAVMTHAYVSDRFALFAVAGCIGIFAREPTILILGMWFLRRPRRTALVMAVAAALLLLEHRLLESGKPDDVVAPLMMEIVRMRVGDLHAFARDVAPMWGWCAGVACEGFVLLRRQSLSLAMPIVAALTCAIVTSLVATDVQRMFAVLLPVFAIGCAAIVRELLNVRARWLLAVLAALTGAQFFLSLPNRRIDYDTWLAIVSHIPAVKIGIVWIALVGVALRRQLAAALADLRQSPSVAEG